MKGIKGKIMKPVAIMAGIFILFAFMQIWDIVLINSRVTNMEHVYFETVRKADELKLSVVQVQQWLTDISATRAAEGYDDGFDEASIYAARVRELIDELKNLDSKNTKMLDEIQESFEPYYNTGIEMAKAYIEYGPEGGNLMMGEFDKVAEDINTKVENFVSYANANIEVSSKKVNAAVIQSLITMIIVIFITLIVLVMTQKLITKRVVKPIGIIKDAAGELANGNLKIQIDYVSEDEIGALATEIKDMIQSLNSYISDILHCMKEMEHGNLNVNMNANFKGDFISLEKSITNFICSINDTMRKVNQSTNRVSNGSEQILEVAQTLAEGAVEQNTSIEKLSSNIIEMAQHVKEESEIAEKANKMVELVGKETIKGMEQMEHMIQAMNQIAGSSNEIVKVIRSIEDIASQTNLLSLNASIEAARAGEAGRGFAVVAGEVANLASESVEAVNHTTVLIDNSRQAVGKGSNIVEETAEMLKKVEAGVKQIIDIMHSIVQTSKEQAKFIESITTEVTQISQVVMTVSATAEESEATSGELLEQVEQLNDLVGQFTLK